MMVRIDMETTITVEITRAMIGTTICPAPT